MSAAALPLMNAKEGQAFCHLMNQTQPCAFCFQVFQLKLYMHSIKMFNVIALHIEVKEEMGLFKLKASV